MTQREMQQRYRGSAFGTLWCVALPLLRFAVYIFVFSFVFGAHWDGIDSSIRGAYAVLMFCGLAVFVMFSESIMACCRVVVGHRNLVKNVVFPLELLPIVSVLSNFIFGMVWIALLYIGTIIVFGALPATACFLPLIILPLFFYSLGVGLFLSSLTVYIRDVQHFVPVILQMLFFLTPIFYSIERIPIRFRWIMRLNPLCTIVSQVRDVVVFGRFPTLVSFAVVYITGILMLYMGYVWFAKTKKGFADVI